jgi:hypothetical protein
MLSIILIGCSDDMKEKIRRLFRELPIERDSALLVASSSEVENAKGESCPYLEIRGSVETPEHVIRTVANHFLPACNVEVYSPKRGIMAFKEAGGRFEDGCFIGGY